MISFLMGMLFGGLIGFIIGMALRQTIQLEDIEFCVDLIDNGWLGPHRVKKYKELKKRNKLR